MADTPPSTVRHKLMFRAALLLIVLLVLAWWQAPDRRLHVFFLDTPGDAILIQSPTGGFVLVDGGSDPATLTTALGRRMPFWRHSLDAVVLTIADGAHLPGQVAVLARYHTDVVLVGPVLRRSAALNEWQRLLQAEGTRMHTVRPGDTLELGGAVLRVLATGDGDESGMLVRIDYGATSVVLAHTTGETELEQPGLVKRPASLVAFPWQREPQNPLLAILRPAALVFTDGQTVEPAARQTYAERAIGGAALYHKRLDGTIEWVSDGRHWEVKTER